MLGFRKKSEQTKLAAKIIQTLFLVLLIPCVVVLAVWIYARTQNAYAEFENNAANTLRELRQQVVSNAAMVDTSVSAAMNQREFIVFCTSDMDADGLALVKFSQNELKTVRSIFQANPVINEASFYFQNNAVYEIWPTIYSADRLKGTPYEDLTLSGKQAIYRVDASTQEVNCCYAVYRDVTYAGLLRLRLQPEVFMQSVYETDGKTQVALLPSAGGMLVEGTFPEEAERVLRAEIPARDTQLGVPGQTDFLLDGETYLASYTYLELLEAWAVVLTKEASVLASTRRTIFFAILLVLGLMAGLWLLVQYVCGLMLRRLSVLEQKMICVQSGDLACKVPARTVGGDELDSLGRSFNQMLDEMRRLIDENVERGLAAKQAEIKALQSQINSHFLYNALESIRMMAELHGDGEVADTVFSLGSLMRYHMNWKAQSVVLREELECIRRFVHFNTMSSGITIELCVDVPEEYLTMEIPKLSIQPLVENSIVHGLPNGKDALHILICCRCEADRLLLCVRDNGCGMQPARLEQLRKAMNGSMEDGLQLGRNGIGVVNVHKRIQLRYGVEYGLRFESNVSEGTCVELCLPNEICGIGGW